MTKINDDASLASAIEHLRNCLPAHDAVWTGQDIANGTADAKPIGIDYDIATILNAVMSGELVPVRPNANAAAALSCEGMSMRNYVAAHAPITLRDAAIACGWNGLATSNPINDTNRAVLWAVMSMMRYEYADAMLAASSGGQNNE